MAVNWPYLGDFTVLVRTVNFRCPNKGRFSASFRQILCDSSIPHHNINLRYKNKSLSRSHAYRSPPSLSFRTILEFAQFGIERQKFAGQRRRSKTYANFPKSLAAQNAVEARGAGKKQSGRCRAFSATAPTFDNWVWLSRARRRRTTPPPPSLFGDTVCARSTRLDT